GQDARTIAICRQANKQLILILCTIFMHRWPLDDGGLTPVAKPDRSVPSGFEQGRRARLSVHRPVLFARPAAYGGSPAFPVPPCRTPAGRRRPPGPTAAATERSKRRSTA